MAQMKRRITVTGVGEVKRVPDIARVELGAEATRPTVVEARDAASEATSQLITALRNAGVDSRDIQTSHVSIQPQHEYPPNEPPRLTGYLAQNSIRVILRDLDKAGATIDAAVTAAGDAGRLNGIQFAFSAPEGLTTEARKRAVQAARSSAKTFADAAGVKLGKVLAMEETGSRGGEPRMLAMRMEAASAKDMPLEAGESTVSVSVTVAFAIKR